MDSINAQHLKLNHLRLIAAIAAHGQLGRAAEVMGITQPAASRTLAEIERNIGTSLCIRSSKGMQLTVIGQVLARRAQNMLVSLNDISREIEELKQGLLGSARIGAVDGAAIRYVVPAVQQLKALSPSADLHIDVGLSDALTRDTLEGIYDFVLARVPPTANPANFDVLSGRPEIIRLVVHRTHPLSSAPSVSLHDLSAFQWVMLGPGVPLRQVVQEAFVSSEADMPADIINSGSVLVMLAMLADGQAIMPVAHEVAELLKSEAIGADVVTLNLNQTISIPRYDLITARGRALSPIAKRLHDLVREGLRYPVDPLLPGLSEL